MLILGGVFERHPGLKVVCVEADAGWAPHYMFRMDTLYERHHSWVLAARLSATPVGVLPGQRLPDVPGRPNRLPNARPDESRSVDVGERPSPFRRHLAELGEDLERKPGDGGRRSQGPHRAGQLRRAVRRSAGDGLPRPVAGTGAGGLERRGDRPPAGHHSVGRGAGGSRPWWSAPASHSDTPGHRPPAPAARTVSGLVLGDRSARRAVPSGFRAPRSARRPQLRFGLRVAPPPRLRPSRRNHRRRDRQGGRWSRGRRLDRPRVGVAACGRPVAPDGHAAAGHLGRALRAVRSRRAGGDRTCRWPVHHAEHAGQRRGVVDDDGPRADSGSTAPSGGADRQQQREAG